MTSKQIYRGQVAVPDHGASGGGSNYMCLPADPEYHPNSPNNVLSATIFRVWYEIDNNLDKLPNLHRDSVPCAVCESDQRLTQLMMPAKTRCPTSDWVLEYSGFLMSSPTQYINANWLKIIIVQAIYALIKILSPLQKSLMLHGVDPDLI